MKLTPPSFQRTCAKNHAYHSLLCVSRWPMNQFLRIFFALVVASLLQGCAPLLNSTERLPTGGIPRPDRAVLVYGVTDEGQWHGQILNVSLDEYSLKQQKITGNCWRFNRTEASVPSATKTVQYFAFDVPAGHYVYSAFHGPSGIPPNAYAAPNGKTVYIGTFVYTQNKTMELRRGIEKETKRIVSALPDLPENIELADAVPVTRPQVFLCAP